MMLRRISGCVAVAVCATLPVRAQHQQPGAPTGWPCSGRVDPAYIHSAEATGWKVLLFAPTEVSGAAEEMAASRGDPQIVAHIAGQLADACTTSRSLSIRCTSNPDSIEKARPRERTRPTLRFPARSFAYPRPASTPTAFPSSVSPNGSS